jgi:hypothetical protein
LNKSLQNKFYSINNSTSSHPEIGFFWDQNIG